MPAFYSQRSAASQMPITPPDSGTGYGYSNMHYPQESYAPQHSQDGGFEYPHSYLQPAIAPGPTAYHYSSSFQPSNSLPPIQSSFYEPMGAPILPPLRINDQIPFADDYQRRLEQQHQHAAAREQQRQTAKEEKATGGVSAKLDYDMDRMTDFVVEATQSMYANFVQMTCAKVNMMRSFQHSMTSPTSFRKWVHQVLSATRLPSATILLSLHYLSDRLHSHPTSVVPGENQIYRLLAVALVLGSKFLDDNTFINRSWSDVTAIKVKELNELERQWLKLISWVLHVDPTEVNGLQAWIDAWKDYEQKAIQKQQAAIRLSPLDTSNVHRHILGSRERFSPYPSPYSATSARPYDQHSARSSQYASTPYSSVDPWASADGHQGIDDFYRRQHRYPTLTEFDSVNNRASDERTLPSSYNAYQQSATAGYYQSPPYTSIWDQQSWTGGHRYDCGCSQCAYQHHYRPHHMSAYSAQTVMG